MSRRKARKKPARAPETSLYAPVKAFLERQGYVVKGEIGACDVLARRGDEPPVVVELKATLNLELILQGVERLTLVDHVYLAIAAPSDASPAFDRRMRKLLRRLGLGLLIVRPRAVEIVLDPAPYRPRKNARRVGRLLGEFERRVGDPNRGGSTRVKLVTAYRQEALRIASLLAVRGPQAPAKLRDDAEAPRAGAILRDDHYGWFERVTRGIYALTPVGAAALRSFDGRFAVPACLAATVAVAAIVQAEPPAA